MPQFDPDPWLTEALWTLVAFAFLFALLKWLVLPRIEGILEARAKAIRKELEQAERQRKEAQALHDAYVERLARVEEEAARLLREAEKRAADIHAETMRQLEEDIRRKKQALWADIEFAKRQALKELHEVAAEAAVMAAEKFIEQRMDRETAQRLVADAIRDIERSAGRERRRLN